MSPLILGPQRYAAVHCSFRGCHLSPGHRTVFVLDPKSHANRLHELMNRRIALKNALLIVGGSILVPTSSRGAQDPSIRLSHLEIDGDDEVLLGEVVDTLIPKTDTPGAKELKVHLFVLLMVDECHEPDEQRAFIGGLKELGGYSKRRFGRGFKDCTGEQRVELLEGLKQKIGISPQLWTFNQLMRKRAIQGYRESQYVMTHLIPHRMIPERYDGYYPASNYEA